MQENEFEKNVQQQMEDLRLRPSDAVWYKVEKELKEKRKRRVIFFLFMLAGIGMLSYLGYTVFNSSSKTLASAQPVRSVNKTSSPTNTQTEAGQPGQISNGQTGNRQIDNGQAGNRQLATLQTNVQSAAVGQQAIKKNKISSDHNPVRDNQKNEFEINVDPASPRQRNMITKIETTTSAKEKGSLTNDLIGDTKDTEPSAIADSLTKKTANKINTPLTSTTIPDSVVMTGRKRKNHSIKWGPDLSIGIASSRSAVFSLSSDRSKALDALAQYNNAASGSGSIVPLQLPSVEKPGLAFKAGVAVEIPLSSTSSIISGLRYTYMSEKIKVGMYAGTVIAMSPASSTVTFSSAYRGPAAQQYINRYHFIELPLIYQLQLNKGKKLPPVSWNIGLSASYLVSTNALVYDTAANGIYYKDKSAFNKFHTVLQTGFYIRLGSERKMQWLIGPDLSLDLSKRLRQNIFADNKYLLYGGITGKLFFGKSKK